jgi:hypothetical protein
MVDEDDNDNDFEQSPADRFQEIMDIIAELAQEAVDLLPKREVARAQSYWYAHIVTAIGPSHHNYISGSMCSMEDSLKKLQCEEDEDE